MGQFSVVIYTRPGSLLSGNQHNAESDEVFDRNSIPAHIYADLSFAYRFDGNMTASFGIRNITDARPPMIYPVYKDTTIYDQVGRYFFTSITIRR